MRRVAPLFYLAVFAIKQVSDHSSSFLVHFSFGAAHVGVSCFLGGLLLFLLGGAVGAVGGEAGLVGLEFKFFRADGADFDWVTHTRSMIPKREGHFYADQSNFGLADW